MDPTDYLHYFPHLFLANSLFLFLWSPCIRPLFPEMDSGQTHALHLTRDSNPQNCLLTTMICNDITSSSTACQRIVTSLASLIFLSLLPHSKPLESNAQTHTNKIRSKGKSHFIKNHRNKWTTSFTNSVWTGDSNCKLVLGPTATAPVGQLKQLQVKHKPLWFVEIST